MLIVNINGPINSGKSTVGKILPTFFDEAFFLEVDNLLSDKEQEQLCLDFRAGIVERLRRLQTSVQIEKHLQRYKILFFAYPMSQRNFENWKQWEDENDKFINITLSPSLENCLRNRGSRELSEREKKRIVEMYQQGYQMPLNSDKVICNDAQTPFQTAQIIKDFLLQFI